MNRVLEPLAQHRALVDWLRNHERAVWDWYADVERQTQDAEAVRLSLLRDTYRMDAKGHPELFAEITAAKVALGLEAVEVFAYQAQGNSRLNAAICYLPGEAHLIFTGPILTLLSSEELRAVIGHELAHYLLWQMDGGAFYLADRILHHAANHPNAEPSHTQSVRLWALATELFADRGALLATDNIETTVATLVKIATGLSLVSGKSYLAQADEIFSKSKPRTEQLTHPETFMRARALHLWADQDEALDASIAKMIEEDEGLDALDLIQQARLTKLTRRFLQHHLAPGWFRSDAVLAHARLYLPDFAPAKEPDAELADELASLSKARREYLCNVMLDFCAVDPDLEDLPVAAAIEQARELECLSHFEKIATKELKLKAKDLKRLKEKAAGMLATAKLAHP
ncbi:MAG: Peptidase Ste24p [Akkermansiaceae bacterium]|nr:Peptidase Ste24p [Akkermansiaceae bacterium]